MNSLDCGSASRKSTSSRHGWPATTEPPTESCSRRSSLALFCMLTRPGSSCGLAKDTCGYSQVWKKSCSCTSRRARGEFLHKMLKSFEGVLVSDFYAAYDSLGCPQQKCLIHLIRDMNQEVLNNPYDEELHSVTQPFGSLLRSIVMTVDEHGLKRRHLERHARDVGQF